MGLAVKELGSYSEEVKAVESRSISAFAPLHSSLCYL